MEVASHGQGANGQIPPPIPVTVMDPEFLLRHIVSLLKVTLEASTEDLETRGSILSDARRNDTVQRCSRFASESQVVLYLQKDIVPSKIRNGLPNGHAASGS